MPTHAEGSPEAQNGAVEHTEYAGMMRRMLRGWVRRLADADAEDVAELVAFGELVAEAQLLVVAGMRGRGEDWGTVGRAFGITRQGAQQRFAGKVEALRSGARERVDQRPEVHPA